MYPEWLYNVFQCQKSCPQCISVAHDDTWILAKAKNWEKTLITEYKKLYDPLALKFQPNLILNALVILFDTRFISEGDHVDKSEKR